MIAGQGAHSWPINAQDAVIILKIKHQESMIEGSKKTGSIQIKLYGALWAFITGMKLLMLSNPLFLFTSPTSS